MRPSDSFKGITSEISVLRHRCLSDDFNSLISKNALIDKAVNEEIKELFDTPPAKICLFEV